MAVVLAAVVLIGLSSVGKVSDKATSVVELDLAAIGALGRVSTNESNYRLVQTMLVGAGDNAEARKQLIGVLDTMPQSIDEG